MSATAVVCSTKNIMEESQRPPGQFDIWTSIQAQKSKQESSTAAPKQEPYVHPLMRRSSSLLSQKSLEVCTESLCSETGSDDFFSSDDESGFFFTTNVTKEQAQENEHGYLFESEERVIRRNGGLQQQTVNYHCAMISSSSSSSSRRRPSPPRSFPPPLPSISRRDGPCLQMRPHRRDGRLVVEAVAVPSQNYLHAERQNGRLLLSFINTASSYTKESDGETDHQQVQEQQLQGELVKQHEDMTAEEEADQSLESLESLEEEEEEVEVVDRGTIVEVKVSTQPPQAMKVHRSSIVINKFVSMPAAAVNNDLTYTTTEPAPPATAVNSRVSPPRRLSSTPTTTAAAAAVAASSVSALSAEGGGHSPSDSRLLFASKRRNKEELLHDMMRCSLLRKPLFIWEPCCIATSS